MFAHLLLLFTFCHFPFSSFLFLLYIPTGWTSGQILCQRRRRISKWNMQNSCQVRLCACVYACVCMTIFRGKLLFGKCLFNHFGRLQQKTLTTCVHMTVISWMLVMRRGSKSTKEVFFLILFSKSSFLTAFKEIYWIIASKDWCRMTNKALHNRQLCSALSRYHSEQN